MQFNETKLKGAFEILPEMRQDERGYFARTFCLNEFAAQGLETNFLQANTSFSAHKNTLRGMHYQKNQFAEAKLVRCIRGKIFDVIIDLRKNSETFLNYHGVELSQKNNKQLYVPRGFAHGYLTMEDDCEITYMVSNFYNPNFEEGVRWNDPLFNIDWPVQQPMLSMKDAAHPDFIA
jgi:dTDP-4-dehydrorhamnose 3,5-epimerase